LVAILPPADLKTGVRTPLMANENYTELPTPESQMASDGTGGTTDRECPLRRVLAVNEHGMVVESSRGFDVGAAMVLGCHVEGETAVFVSAETIVVESCPLMDGRGVIADRFQVTVLFSEISWEDRDLLVNLSDVEGIQLASGPTARRSGLAIPPPQVFPVVNEGRANAQSRVDGIDPSASSGCSLN